MASCLLTLAGYAALSLRDAPIGASAIQYLDSADGSAWQASMRGRAPAKVRVQW